MEIVQATGAEDLELVRQLFQEYFRWVQMDIGVDLAYQRADEELAALPSYYAPPAGRLLLARESSGAREPAGCVALRPLAEDVCELKRMYVRPWFRGQGLGWALAERAIKEAREIGYRAIRLDTADTLAAARAIYAALGFREIPQYYNVPADVLKRTIFMELSLEGNET